MSLLTCTFKRLRREPQQYHPTHSAEVQAQDTVAGRMHMDPGFEQPLLAKRAAKQSHHVATIAFPQFPECGIQTGVPPNTYDGTQNN